MADLIDLTVAEAAARIRSGDVSRDEYFDAYREAAAGDSLNAFLWTAEDAAQADLEGTRTGREQRHGERPLEGIPVAVKDIFCTEGIPTTAGSRILEGYRPPYTATAVRKLHEAGARVLGKANMDEFAMGSSNENSGYGPVLNPWDSGRVPGGSSGGSAAAVAGRLAPCAIGTDTGGSIRQPAALCGIVGMKPTYGAVSRYGMIAFASSLDQCGPLTRNVTDAALILQAVEGRDGCDSTSLGIEGGISLPSREDLTGLSFGVPKELASEAEGIESGVREVFERTVELIEELGGEVSETELPHAPHGISAYYVLAPAEASANLARFDGVRYGLRVDAGDLTEMYEETRAQGFGAEVKRRIMLGTYALSSGYYEAYYGRAQRVRTKIAEDFSKAFERFDFVVTPTSPTVAFKLGAKTDDPLAMYMNDYCTVPMPLAGIPAISIPAGVAQPDGGGPELPVGFQIAGPAFSDSAMLDAALALEGAIGFRRKRRRRSGLMAPNGYEPVIGLEIHVQLSTETKMLCGCAVSFGDEPNVHTCPVCLGHPGSLPTINEQAIRSALMIAAALECDVARRSVFARKNYFYPDLPKGYQISQYDEPIAVNGRLGDVRIHRAHLEEDAAKLNHVGESGRIHGSGASLVDFNRGGTPLVEIVTEPDIRSPAQAREWAQLLRTTIRQLGVSDVNMEEGSLRVDGNISIRPAGVRRAGHQDRAQEHEQLPVPRAGNRGGDRAAAGGAGERGGGRPGNLPLPPRGRLAHPAALEGVRPRLSLLPGARPGPGGADRADAEGGTGVAARAAGRQARALRLRDRALGRCGEHPRLQRRIRGVLRAGDRGRRRHTRRGDRQLGDRRAGRRTASGRRRGGPTRVEGDARGRRRAGRSRRGRRRSPTAPASRSWRSWSRREEIPHRSWRRRASARSRTPRSSRGSSSARSKPRPRPPRRSARATRRRSAGSSER